jgi:methionine--tRNA ligase beta chain
METITYDDFMKLDIRIGKILAAEKIEGTEKLLKLEMEVGEEKRTLVAGIAQTYLPEDLLGREVPVLLNLEPRKIRGIESQGMILAADDNGTPVILNPERLVPAGSVVR